MVRKFWENKNNDICLNQTNFPVCGAVVWVHWLLIVSAKEYTYQEAWDLALNIHKHRPPKTQGQAMSISDGFSTMRRLTRQEEQSLHVYRNIAEIIDYVLTKGPMPIALRWYKDMQYLTNGMMEHNGRYTGNHGVLITGVDTDENIVQIKNSYGKSWGANGYARMNIGSLSDILDENNLQMAAGVKNV